MGIIKIEISGETPQQLKGAIESIMNSSSIMCGYGYIPNDHEIEKRETSGRLWNQEEMRFNILPISNDYWFNVDRETETSIKGWFSARYDSDGKKKKALTDYALAFFPDRVKTIEE